MPPTGAVCRPQTPPAEHARLLVQAAACGDAEAFGELYLIHRDAVFRYIRRRVARWPVAEDLTSETFARALRGIAAACRVRNFESWLVAIAHNLVVDHYKSGYHRREVSVAYMLDADRHPVVDDIAGFLNALDHQQLRAAVLCLNPLQRQCIVLRYFQQLSLAQTADAMDRSVGAVKLLQYRALRTLDRMLDPLIAAAN